MLNKVKKLLYQSRIRTINNITVENNINIDNNHHHCTLIISKSYVVQVRFFRLEMIRKLMCNLTAGLKSDHFFLPL